MYLSTSILVSFLLATAKGWQVLIIDETNQDCESKPDTRARLIMGSGKQCYTLGGDMGNTDCVHYLWQNDQFVEQASGCQENFFPQSTRYFDMGNTGAVCEFFDGDNCSDRKIRPHVGDHKVCAAEAVLGGADGVSDSGGLRVHSFKCTPPTE